MAENKSVVFFNPNVTVTDGGYFIAGPSVNWSMRTHAAPISKIYFITEGECEITVHGATYKAKAGDLFFIPARVEHSYHNFAGTAFKKYWMQFELYPGKDIVKLLGIDYRIREYDSERVVELFKRFTSLYGSKDFSDCLSVKAIALELLSIYVRAAGTVVREKAEEGYSEFSSVFSYIENNLSVKISNKTLADIAHMHPTHFIRSFKKETGQTPCEYVAQRKMERAKYLLESTELQIGEIAENLGYFDTMHFSKTFKKRHSVSPTAYRKIHVDE